MAGEWLKMELTTPDKPEVLRMARILGINKDTVLGKLVRVWAWFDKNTVDGHVDGVESGDVDDIAQHDGFTVAMKQVGWLDFSDLEQWVVLVNFDRHNGETAKTRALKTKRQQKWREGVDAKQSTKTSTPLSTPPPTREEKRRDKTYTPPKAAFCFKTELLNLGVESGLVDDWLKVRKTKKASNTQTAFAKFLSEVKKAGWLVPAAVAYCTEKDWKGFDADWVKDVKPVSPAIPFDRTAYEAKRKAEADAAKARMRQEQTQWEAKQA